LADLVVVGVQSVQFVVVWVIVLVQVAPVSLRTSHVDSAEQV
jgi:predicted secreted protein